MPDQSADRVDTPSVAHKEMARKWDMLHALLGGTQAMRDAGIKWLPQEPKEKNDKYKIRKDRSFLFGAFADTIKRLTGKPYSKPITLQGELPEPLEGMEDNVDGRGRNLTQFGRAVFKAGTIYGLTHILVDFPRMTDAEGNPVLATAADDMDTPARPVFMHVTPPNLIGWKYENNVLTEIRVREWRTEPDGTWADKKVEYVRVYRTNDWELHRRDKEGGDFRQVSQGPHTFGAVPLVTFYASEESAPLTAEPPLEDLAWLNVAHWQTYSDVRNILRFASVGILFGSGFTEEEIEKNTDIGPHTVMRSDNAEAKLAYVEYRGKAIEAGQLHLERLEERMEALGSQPLIRRKSGSTTATGKKIDESRSDADAESWARGEENTIRTAFEFAAKWRDTELQEDFGVNIFNEFGISLNKDSDVKALIDLWTKKGLDIQTVLEEIARRGLLSEGTDIEVIMQRLAQAAELEEPDEGPEEDDENDEEDEEEEEVEEEETTGARS